MRSAYGVVSHLARLGIDLTSRIDVIAARSEFNIKFA